MAYYEILKAGGFTTGGTNFDSKLRRQSLDPQDLILAHAGAFDVCARGYKAAHAMLSDGALQSAVADRYVGWESADSQKMLSETLEQVAARASAAGFDPQPASGRQERLENIVNKFV
jgi:xylose isomerase